MTTITAMTAYERAKVDKAERARVSEAARVDRQRAETERTENVKRRLAGPAARLEQQLQLESAAIQRDGGKPTIEGPIYRGDRLYVALSFTLNTTPEDVRRNVIYKFTVDVHADQNLAYAAAQPVGALTSGSAGSGETRWSLGAPDAPEFEANVQRALETFMMHVVDPGHAG
ncbi:hypothetical protein [Schauerella aestuarii]|uniref:hypothetical protein n=1 Tax=Schauerella aestuarii TaxID=2511204 RepID=UPI001367C8A4|nr:hypothetical protein [Achromobacter aestuarii]MYZ45501.1 hypothetical protein [Achromobacter aestuarii]